MKASDVMVSPVITVDPETTVSETAKILLDRGVSAVPVVDSRGQLVGIVSEGDLIRRSESETERRRSWWLEAFIDSEMLATEYTKAHARKVADVMSSRVITAQPDTPLHEIATLLEKNSIKRVPIVKDGQLVGIVSRANLVQAVASARSASEVSLSDTEIRERLVNHLKQQKWVHPSLLNVTVKDGIVDLWGVTRSDAETQALRVAAESIPGVQAVNDHMLRRAAWT